MFTGAPLHHEQAAKGRVCVPEERSPTTRTWPRFRRRCTPTSVSPRPLRESPHHSLMGFRV